MSSIFWLICAALCLGFYADSAWLGMGVFFVLASVHDALANFANALLSRLDRRRDGDD